MFGSIRNAVRGRSAFLFALSGLLGACADAAAPRWISLARGHVPMGSQELVGQLGPGWAGIGLRPGDRDDGVRGLWVELVLPREQWKKQGLIQRPAPGAGKLRVWSVPRPPTAGFRGQAAERCRLFSVAGEYEAIEPRAREDKEKRPGFVLHDASILLRLPEGEPVPDEVVFATWIERGQDVGGNWRAAAREIVCEGLPVWSGEQAVLTLDLPAQSVLMFSTVARAVAREGQVVFRVELDGEPILESARSTAAGRSRAHVLALPAGGRRASELRFSVSGDPAVCLFANPWVVPAERGSFGERPWEQERPDLLLFLADTFRADNMSAYGGDSQTCPELNSLADESVLFVNARSNGVWTLPSHASMFTGLLPPQHGAIWRSVTFSDELVTLAEHLRRSGYRTCAVTDSAFVSRAYGMDRGFEWFEEAEHALRDLRSTLAAADELLARDDGRPIFLFVHTYRTHEPYRLGPEEDTGPRDEFQERVAQALRAWDGKADPSERFAAFSEELMSLYRGGATALDARFGEWYSTLLERGFFERGYLAFTSDHGEAFGEHGQRGHGRMPHDEKVRIPFFLHGGDLSPRRVSVGVSLVDLAPTMSALAGLSAPDTWIGRPLLALQEQRPVFSFNWNEEGTYFAVTSGTRKLLARSPADVEPAYVFSEEYLLEAYELSEGSGETDNVLGEAAWSQELLYECAPLWRRLARPQASVSQVEVSGDLAEKLRALGYGD
ncbi:MAG: hypothetical protein CMJ89_03145 [Planctomycetes bacterium]|nr:hypothetical protein [Planctomycetota bacterium]